MDAYELRVLLKGTLPIARTHPMLTAPLILCRASDVSVRLLDAMGILCTPAVIHDRAHPTSLRAQIHASNEDISVSRSGL